MKGMSFTVASAIFMLNRLNLFLKQENKEESVCAARTFERSSRRFGKRVA
jgi:hypothetical protein